MGAPEISSYPPTMAQIDHFTRFLQAVRTVAHEYQHLLGEYDDEAKVECSSNQFIPQILRELGYDERLIEEAAAYLAFKNSYMPDEYQSPSCAVDGDWDAELDGSYFQTPSKDSFEGFAVEDGASGKYFPPA